MAYIDTVNAMNPVHFWDLRTSSADIGTGTTLDGTDTNMEYESCDLVAGYTNGASFNLDGSIAIATSSDLDNIACTEKTISLFIKPTLDTLVFDIIKIGSDSGGMYICMGAGLVPMVGIVNSTEGTAFFGTPIRINEPTHLLVEFNNGSVKLYQNGELTIDDTSSITTIPASSSGTKIGENATVMVGTSTFQTYDLHAKLGMLCTWNSLLTTQQKTALFNDGAQSVTRQLNFVNLPEKTEVRVYDIDNNLDLLDGGVEFIDGVTGSDISIDFDVLVSLNVRVVLHNVEAKLETFNADIALGRNDATYDGALILRPDRNYNNPGGWAQPIPLALVTAPYLTGKTGDGETLYVNEGVYTGSGTHTKTYQWYRDGSPIGGETGMSYTMEASDIDLPIFCREHCDNVIGYLDTDTKVRTWLNVKLYAIYEENTGELIPSTSWVKVDFGNEIQNINGEFSNSNGDYSVPDGDFLVIATMKYVDGSNGRVCPEGRVNYTGDGLNVPIYGSGFSRNTGNNTSWIRSTSYVYNATAGDTISFEHRSDSDVMAGGSIAEYCHIQIINMSPQAGLFANDLNDTGTYEGQTWNTIQWDTQMDSFGSGITKSGNTFTLSANKDYLISYGIALANTGGSTRTQRISKAVIDGTDVPQSFSYAYMRQNTDEYGDIGNMFMYQTGGSDEVLELLCQRGNADNDGGVVRRVNTSSVFILDVTGANYYSSYDSTGDQLITVTNDLPHNLAETELVTTPDLTKTSSSMLTCQTEGYWILGSASFVDNPAKSGSTRMTRGMKFVVNGDSQKVGESGSYQRNDQSSTDTWNMAMGTVGVYHLLQDDEVEFMSFDAGDDGNSESYTVGNQCGLWALDINSI